MNFIKTPSFGGIGALVSVLSLFTTSLIIIYLWTWLNPTDFWQKVIAVIVSLVSGVALFLILSVVFLIILSPFILFFMKRKIEKMFEEMPGDDLMYE